VGGAGRLRGAVAVGRPYDGLAAVWEADAGPVYRSLAERLVQASPLDLARRSVLDLGSGTGAVARAVADRGSRVVMADASFDMVAQAVEAGAGSVADARALPFRDGGFDAATAGFLLNHLPPAPTLAEMARVVRPGGAVLASTWSAEGTDPVKVLLDALLVAEGWEPPAWYRAMKAEVEPVSGHPDQLEAAARRAGLVGAHAEAVVVDLGLREPGAVVAYRLAMPHIAPWRAGLSVEVDADLTARLATAVAPLVAGWRPSVLLLTARVAVSRGRGRPPAPAPHRTGPTVAAGRPPDDRPAPATPPRRRRWLPPR
jgi:SAM-dependent methyltransferase